MKINFRNLGYIRFPMLMTDDERLEGLSEWRELIEILMSKQAKLQLYRNAIWFPQAKKNHTEDFSTTGLISRRRSICFPLGLV